MNRRITIRTSSDNIRPLPSKELKSILKPVNIESRDALDQKKKNKSTDSGLSNSLTNISIKTTRSSENRRKSNIDIYSQSRIIKELSSIKKKNNPQYQIPLEEIIIPDNLIDKTSIFNSSRGLKILKKIKTLPIVDIDKTANIVSNRLSLNLKLLMSTNNQDKMTMSIEEKQENVEYLLRQCTGDDPDSNVTIDSLIEKTAGMSIDSSIHFLQDILNAKQREKESNEPSSQIQDITLEEQQHILEDESRMNDDIDDLNDLLEYNDNINDQQVIAVVPIIGNTNEQIVQDKINHNQEIEHPRPENTSNQNCPFYQAMNDFKEQMMNLMTNQFEEFHKRIYHIGVELQSLREMHYVTHNYINKHSDRLSELDSHISDMSISLASLCNTLDNVLLSKNKEPIPSTSGYTGAVQDTVVVGIKSIVEKNIERITKSLHPEYINFCPELPGLILECKSIQEIHNKIPVIKSDYNLPNDINTKSQYILYLNGCIKQYVAKMEKSQKNQEVKDDTLKKSNNTQDISPIESEPQSLIKKPEITQSMIENRMKDLENLTKRPIKNFKR